MLGSSRSPGAPGWPRCSPSNAIFSRRAISRSPSTRAGSSGGSVLIKWRIRLRSCSAKCGVDAPISWRTSSTVGSRTARSGRSYSLIGFRSLWRVRLYRNELGELVDLRLLVHRQGLVVAQDPGAVVDRLARILLVARLHAEEVLLELRRELLRVVAQEQRGEHPASGERGGRRGICRTRCARES